MYTYLIVVIVVNSFDAKMAFPKALLFFSFLLFFLQNCATFKQRQNFSVVVFLPSHEDLLVSLPFSDYYLRPAGELAFESAQTLLPGAKLTPYFRKDTCDPREVSTLNHLLRSLKNNALDATIGPMCEWTGIYTAPVNNHFDKPLITVGSIGKTFDLKHGDYSTLTRIYPADKFTSQASLHILNHNFAWRRNVYFLTSKSNILTLAYCRYLITTIESGYKKTNQNATIGRSDISPSINSTQMSGVLQDIAEHSRIVVMCASSDTVRKIMLEAHKLEMTNGEYAFFNIIPFDSQYYGYQGERMWYREGDQDNDDAKEAYRALMSIRLHKPTPGDAYKAFETKVKEKALSDFGYSYDDNNETVNSFVAAFHDAVILYATALNESLTDPNSDPRNGTELTRRMWNRTFEGITGNVTIDENGDRDSDYALLEMTDIEAGTFEVVGIFSAASKSFSLLPGKSIDWPGPKAPLDVPICGFKNENCEDVANLPIKIAFSVMIIMLLLFVLIILYVFRKYKYEKELSNMSWKVKWDDITFNSKKKKVPTATLR